MKQLIFLEREENMGKVIRSPTKNAYERTSYWKLFEVKISQIMTWPWVSMEMWLRVRTLSCHTTNAHEMVVLDGDGDD